MCSVGALSTCVQVTMRNALQVHQTKMGVEMLKYISFNAISKFVQISTKNHLRAWKVSFFLSLKVEILFNFTQNQRPLSHVCLGAFVKLRNATIRFVMSVCPPVRLSVHPPLRPHETTRLSLDWFSWNLIFEYFRKSVEKIQGWLSPDQNNRVLYMKTNIHLW